MNIARQRQPMDRRLTIRLPEELYQKAKEKSEREDITLSQVLRRALRKWIEDPPEEEEETP
jgi:predicted DNA-binding protein